MRKTIFGHHGKIIFTLILVMLAVADDRWLTIVDVSERIQIPVRTLRDWRRRGHGPPSTKLGRGQSGQIRYRLSAVDAWERATERAEAEAAEAARARMSA
jgi:hypothetical protein